MRHKLLTTWKIPAAVGLLGLLPLLLLGGCGDDTLSSGANLQVTSMTVYSLGTEDIGSSVTVEVHITDVDGTAISGGTVSFSVSPSSLGYFTPASDTSDADGVVTTVFTATSSGTATLTATAGVSSKSSSLQILSSSSSEGLVSVQVVPQILTANGSDAATVTVTAVDDNGDPVEDGTVIYLTAGERFEDRDQNGYWTNNVDSLIFDANANHVWDPIGTIPSTVTTQNGTATATYVAGNQATTVYVRASMITNGSSDFAEATVKLNPNTTVANISLTHHFEDLRVRGVGGIEWTEIIATAYDEYGNTVPEGVEISFTIAAGPGGGENIEGEGYGPVTVSTNQSGQATVVLYSGTVSGTIKMRAESGSIVSAVTHIVVNAGPPANISIGAEHLNQRSWDKINVSNKIGANVSDIWGNPVPDSTVIWFSTEEGFVVAHALTGVDLGKGLAQTTWFSGNPRNDGIVFVYGCTDGGEYGQLCDTVAFISSGPAITVSVLDYPPTLQADGVDKAKVTVEVRDINQNFVVQNTPVEFNAKYGAIAGGGTVDGWNRSIVEADYNSQTLPMDYSPIHPDDGVGAYSLVTATADGMGGPNAKFTTAFLTGETYYKNSLIDIAASIEPGTTEPFTISVKDRAGNPLGGHELTVTTTVGTISGESFITDKYGEVNLWYQAPPAVGSTLITVTDEDPRGQVSFAQKVKIEYPE